MSDNGRFPAQAAGVPVVTAPEELDITNARHLESALAEAAATGHGSFAVDMSRTRFCDSAGLHVLLAAHKRARADGGGLVLAIAGQAVLRLFEITGADTVIPCFASLEEALAHACGIGQQADGVAGNGDGQALQGSVTLATQPPHPLRAPPGRGSARRTRLGTYSVPRDEKLAQVLATRHRVVGDCSQVG